MVVNVVNGPAGDAGYVRHDDCSFSLRCAMRSSGLRASTANADARLNAAPRLRIAVIGVRRTRFTLLLLNRRRWF